MILVISFECSHQINRLRPPKESLVKIIKYIYTAFNIISHLYIYIIDTGI